MITLFTFLIGCVFAVAAAAGPRVSESYGQLPLHFEENRGQTHEDARFLSRGPGYSLFLTAGEAVLVLGRQEEAPVVVRMGLVDAAPAPLVRGLEKLPGKANYFIGNDPSKWRTNVPTYAKVQYRAVYPGIDLLYYGNQRQLEYDFVVAPGADPNKIVLGFQGLERLEIDVQGDLVLHTLIGSIRMRKPVVYQHVDGARKEIPGEFRLRGGREVGFVVAAYDAGRPLIIDPVLVYSTYFGGSDEDFTDMGIAVDGSGHAYVTGATRSLNFPTTKGAFPPGSTTPAFRDAFVAKLKRSGKGLVYSTYLGGNRGDQGVNIAVDARGNAYVTGRTGSTDFPTTEGAFQRVHGGGVMDAFVTKLNRRGDSLVYSTYLGGSGTDFGQQIVPDAAGRAYVAGNAGAGFPTTPGAFQRTFGGGADDAFVAKLNASGSALIYSTYLGGSGSDVGRGLAADAQGNAYVSGHTSSADFRTKPGAFQIGSGGGFDGFVAKLNSTATALVYLTFLGGSGEEQQVGIALDTARNAYVAGRTRSIDFPTTRGAFQESYGGGQADAFVAKLNAAGSALVYSTYLGGEGYDDNFGGIAVDVCGNAHVVGETGSIGFPTKRAFQRTYGGQGPPSVFCADGCRDAYVTKLNAKGARLVYSSYLGGSSGEFANAIALDHFGNVHMAGTTQTDNDSPQSANDFPLVKPLQPNYGGGTSDAFIAKVAERRREDRDDDDSDEGGDLQCRGDERDGDDGDDDDDDDD